MSKIKKMLQEQQALIEEANEKLMAPSAEALPPSWDKKEIDQQMDELSREREAFEELFNTRMAALTRKKEALKAADEGGTEGEYGAG